MSEKTVNVATILRVKHGQPETTEQYLLLDKAISQWHPRLSEASIVVQMHSGWLPDPDSIMRLGSMRKRNDSERDLAEYDAVLTLNAEAWEVMDERRKIALVDHECCHLQIVADDETDDLKKRDANGRVCYRIRKHDIEEFKDVVARHGCYKNDLEDFVKEAIEKSKPSLFREVLSS